MIRYGTVSIVNYEKGTVKAVLEDIEEQTAELIVFQGRNKGIKQYSMPVVGEHGLCLITDNGSSGYYLGAGFNEVEAVMQGSGKGKTITHYSDGTQISYDENTSKLFIDCKKDIEIICPKISITGDITINGDIQLNGGMNATNDVIADGVSLIDHTHSGVKAGGDTSGQPVK